MPHSKNAPLHPGQALIGNSLQATRDPCRFFAKAHARLGPVFRIRYPGQQMLILAGIEANRLFARRGDSVFSNACTYQRMAREMKSDATPNCHDGDRHLELRRLLGPALSLTAIEPFVPRLFARVEQLVSSWQDAQQRHIESVLRELVFDLVSISTTNLPVRHLASDVSLYGTMMGVVAVGHALPEKTLSLPPVRRARRRFAAFLESALEDRRKTPTSDSRPPDVLDALLALERSRPDRFDRQALLALAMLPLKNAGIYLYRHVSFALYEILRDPSLRDRLRDEADACLATGEPSVLDLKRMERLNATCLEALRRYPMAIALPRVIDKAFTFQGYDFEPGQMIYIAGPATHFLPELFPEPDQFDPDRCRAGRNEHLQPHAYAPFGLGRHSCMSRGLSLTLAKVVLAGLLRHGDLRLAEPDRKLVVRGFPRPIPEARFRLALHRRAMPSQRTGHSQPTSAVETALAGLDSEARERLQRDLSETSFEPDVVIFHEGDEADSFFVIRSGHADVLAERDGELQQLARLGPGQFFGEMGLLQRVPRTATVRVAGSEPLETLRLGRDAFNALAADCDLTSSELAATMRRQSLTRTLATLLSNTGLSNTGHPSLDAKSFEKVDVSWITQEYAAGDLIIRQGDVAESFYLLVSGEVQISNQHPSGNEIPLARLEAVDYFGEIGLLEKRPRTATVRACGDLPTRVIRIDRPNFERLSSGSQSFRASLGEKATARMVRLMEGSE